jgi:pimeloyl-ACP methyl ester carboxylesterase
MKKNLFWKISLILLLGVAGIWGIPWLTYERQPLPDALEALKSDDLVTVTFEPWLTFSPTHDTPTTGFIFYPGGRISNQGYSDFMKAIASGGYLVVVPKMPLNIAAFSPDLADEIIAHHPEITRWVIGGHSIGGTMAAQYAKTHPNIIAGLIIWASYPADNADLSSSILPVALIYGSLDPTVNDTSVTERKHLLPPTTLYVRIEGGDHHQFGSYVIQPDEHFATTEAESQQTQIIKATLDLLNKISGTQ